MDVQDANQLVQQVLEDKMFSGDVMLYGSSYGGFVAAKMAAVFPDRYQVVVAESPMLDLSAMTYLPRFVLTLLGENADAGWTADLKAEAFER